MAEGDFKSLVFGSVLFSLVAVLLLTVVIDMGTTYEKNVSEVTGSMNIQEFNNSINNIVEDSKDFEEKFSGSSKNSKYEQFADILGFLSFGIFGVLLDIFSFILTPIKLLNAVLEQSLGIPKLVVNVVLGLFIIGVIFAIYRVVKIGE